MSMFIKKRDHTLKKSENENDLPLRREHYMEKLKSNTKFVPVDSLFNDTSKQRTANKHSSRFISTPHLTKPRLPLNKLLLLAEIQDESHRQVDQIQQRGYLSTYRSGRRVKISARRSEQITAAHRTRKEHFVLDKIPESLLHHVMSYLLCLPTQLSFYQLIIHGMDPPSHQNSESHEFTLFRLREISKSFHRAVMSRLNMIEWVLSRTYLREFGSFDDSAWVTAPIAKIVLIRRENPSFQLDLSKKGEWVWLHGASLVKFHPLSRDKGFSFQFSPKYKSSVPIMTIKDDLERYQQQQSLSIDKKQKSPIPGLEPGSHG